MISCTRVGKTWLSDVDLQRDGKDAAEATDLGQAVFGANLKARWAATVQYLRSIDALRPVCCHSLSQIHTVRRNR